jgi:NDP-sugar pyrophosphorylase family protein
LNIVYRNRNKLLNSLSVALARAVEMKHSASLIAALSHETSQLYQKAGQYLDHISVISESRSVSHNSVIPVDRSVSHNCYMRGQVNISHLSYVRGQVNISHLSYISGQVSISHLSYITGQVNISQNFLSWFKGQVSIKDWLFYLSCLLTYYDLGDDRLCYDVLRVGYCDVIYHIFTPLSSGYHSLHKF